jgi:hypothetical protein
LHIDEKLNDEQLGTLFTSAFLTPLAGEAADRSTRTAAVRHRVRETYAKIQMNQEPTRATIKPVLKTLESNHDQIVARYLLLQELAEIQRQEHRRRLILAVDNMDPFPEYLQKDFIRTLETVEHGFATISPARRKSFSVVLFARYSTATRHSGTLDGVSAHRVNFRAPDPADLVFFKLSMFLLNLQGVVGWDMITKSDREELVARAWYLWEKLASPKSQFSQVFSGLAGTNARTGYKLASWWLTSPRLSYRLAPKEPIVGEETVARALAFALLVRLAHAVARGIRADEAPESLEAWEKLLVAQFFDNLLGVMVDNHVVRRRTAPYELKDDVRALLSDKARSHLAALLGDPIWKRVRDAANAPVAEAVYDVSEIVRKVAQPGTLADTLGRALRREEQERRHRLNRIEQRDHEMAEALCFWLLEAAVRGAAAINRQAAEGGDPADVLPGVVRPFERSSRPNRWEAVSVLVSPESDRRRTEHSAINLFSADGITVSPVALHVLCQLEEKDRGLEGVLLRERLRHWGFDDHQIMQAFRDMVTVDRRLIYCGVKDSAFELEGWFDTYHEVKITSAGSSYLNRVGSTPAYLQWALLEASNLYEHLGGGNREAMQKRLATPSGRVDLVLRGLKHVYADESERLRHLVRSSVDAQRSLSPLCWVFFGSLRKFIRDISGFKVGEEKRRLAEEFLLFAKELRADRLQLFPVFPRDWDHSLADAEEDFRERFS